MCVIQRERQTRHQRRHVERGREREKLQVGERLLQFSSCLLGMSWLRISQNDLLGEKRREMGRRGARKREKGMKCHWGIPLSSPVLPTLSRAVHFIPLCLCPSLFPLLTFPPLRFRWKFSPLCATFYLVVCFCPLLALFLVVSRSPLLLSPSLLHQGGCFFLISAPLFPFLLAPLSIILPQPVQFIDIVRQCSITATQSNIWYS